MLLPSLVYKDEFTLGSRFGSELSVRLGFCTDWVGGSTCVRVIGIMQGRKVKNINSKRIGFYINSHGFLYVARLALPITALVCIKSFAGLYHLHDHDDE